MKDAQHQWYAVTTAGPSESRPKTKGGKRLRSAAMLLAATAVISGVAFLLNRFVFGDSTGDAWSATAATAGVVFATLLAAGSTSKGCCCFRR